MITKIKRIDDLLTPEEREVLYRDLALIAKQRQKAADMSAHIPMA